MAVAALIGVHSHWVVSWVAADTERGVKDVAKSSSRVINVEVCLRRGLVHMAVQAVDWSLISVLNNHFNCGTRGCERVDVAGGIMTGGAASEVGGEDVRPAQYRVTVGAGLRVCLCTVGHRIHLYGMVNGATSCAMVMASEVSRVTA